MRREQRQYLLYLRLRLGNALRRAHDAVEPLVGQLEKGYRWEHEEIDKALSIADDLHDHVAGIAERVDEFATRYKGSLTPAEKGRLVGGKKYGTGAWGGMRKATHFLADIRPAEMDKLEAAWIDGKVKKLDEGHEAYFMRRYNGAMRLLRLSWAKMFYASEKPSPRRIVLTERETSAFYNPMSPGVARKVREDADELSERSGDYVEVYDADKDLVYVAVPPTTMAKAELERARQRARPRGKKVKQAIANLSEDKQDASLLVEMWQWNY